MIERYTLPEMGQVWEEAEKFNIWADVETAAAKAQGAPVEVVRQLSSPDAVPTPGEVAEAEAVTRHDVVAFVQAYRSKLTEEAGRWVHRNMTSSDLVDTANAVRLARSGGLLIDRLDDLITLATHHAIDHRDTIRIGRTHGQHAEVTSWGYRVADFVFGLDRAASRLSECLPHVSTMKLSGPVGDYKRITPRQEADAARELGLRLPDSATQVLMRDGYADFVHSCAQICSVIEAMAMEVRLGQRSEVGELAEGFAPGQRGSSAMPHKRNPITSEQLCGIARMVRAQIVPVMEGVALHHERDISHSSVERIALPTAAILTHYALTTACDLWSNLVVNRERMRENAVAAQRVSVAAAIKDMLVDWGVDPDVAWLTVHNATAPGSDDSVIDRLKVELDRMAPEVSQSLDYQYLRGLTSKPLDRWLRGNTDRVFNKLIDRFF